ncbi:transposase [Acinetobacter pittii 42F]|nr:transposase [Acinetobacter pittii 42F]
MVYVALQVLLCPPLEKFAQLVDYHMAFETVAPHV